MTIDALHEAAADRKEIMALRATLFELVECAILRGDCNLPAPPDDPKMWTSRMQTAWDEARVLVDGPEMDASIARSRQIERR